MPKQTLLGLTLTELQEVVKRLGMLRFSAKQIASWLYDKKVNSIDDMTNLSLKHRDLLKDVYEVGAEAPVEAMRSTDGTVKYLYRAGDKNFVEAVYIPDEDRATLCVSSQVGCKMNCKFCMTGKQGFSANLTANQIINQINSLPERDKLTNVVMMGMGEPLLNLRETTRALEMLNHDKGMDFSPRRITVSTCGIKAGLRELGDSGLAFLAVSLHAPNQELRAKIMPKAANWHLDDLMATLESYPLKTREHITFEYLLLGGVNDQPEHARELGLVVKLHDEPGVDEDGTARHGEGVHAVVQQHVGGEREGLRGEGFGEAVHNGLDVALDFGVFHKRHTGADEHVELASEFFFVLDAETAEKRGLRRDRALQEQGE